jgi:hypothetical protein
LSAVLQARVNWYIHFFYQPHNFFCVLSFDLTNHMHSWNNRDYGTGERHYGTGERHYGYK